MGGRWLLQGCRRVVVPSGGGCHRVRALQVTRVLRGTANCAVPAAGGALREDIMRVAARDYVMLHDFSFLSLLT